ncbi:MAG: FAD:protein FMN transferase [Candidatus Cloacimonadaceae bacterium]|nr:FAD:protein FMN transferase [Candidatus Cloacimonadota bacterium]MDX9949591.1 FAD:protein FMN transferase [Candidatus Syntrophosphaera sp.]NLN85133.1 FAD:protein FMN transferase [Candidatus Cloacimonadota bacterium]
MTKKEIVSLILLALVIAYGAWTWFNRSYSHTRAEPDLMDTVVTISAKSKSKNISAQIDSVFAYMKSFEAIFNDYDPQSWVSRVNAADGKSVPMNPHAYELLCLADSLYHLTDGLFDISVRPLYELWGFSRLGEPDFEPSPPDSLAIQETLAKVNFSRIRYNEKRIIMPKGMQITFGALAKGYVLDRARVFMERSGLISGQIDCTSGMTFFGQKHAQVVGVRHPRAGQNLQTIGSFKIKNGSLSSSGDYQNFFEYEGKRYHHILNPKTGYPVESVFSITVIHPSAAVSDGLSTALFLLPPPQAIEALTHYPNSNSVIFYQEQDKIVSLKSMGMKELDWHDE